MYYIMIVCTRVGKSRVTVVSMQNIKFTRILIFINYGIIYLFDNCKPTFAHPCNNERKICKRVKKQIAFTVFKSLDYSFFKKNHIFSLFIIRCRRFVQASSLLYTTLPAHSHTALPSDEDINEQQSNWEVCQAQ